MAGHACHHCKQWVEEGEAHDCWSTTEAALTAELTDDLREAWERLRETAVEFGPQRIYASHHSIMFSRKSCYFFVRPKRRWLEVVVFLGRAVRSPQVHRVVEASRAKRAHVIRIEHRDQVEAPITDWLREAYEFVGESRPNTRATTAATARKVTARPPKKVRRREASASGTAARGRGTRRR